MATRTRKSYVNKAYNNQGFYAPTDNIAILNIMNLTSTIYGCGHAWIVQFYNSCSPICKLYAPTWRSLYNDIHPWKDIVSLAVIDCANPMNRTLRAVYGLERYPEIRYFGPNESITSRGTTVPLGKDLYELRRNVLTRLIIEQQEGRGGKWPNLMPIMDVDDLREAWRRLPETIKFFFLLFDNDENFISSEVIMDLHRVNCLALRRVNSENMAMRLMHNVTDVPAITFYDYDGEPKNSYAKTREEMRDAVELQLDLLGCDEKFPEITDDVYMDEWLNVELLARFEKNQRYGPRD